ncbi:ABC transporter [Paenibacillus beijingensis]|uniref:ABC transporter n=1 Tax=Paenibacillus beijingensis TaxID=1126833 RepID=A0A0D5NPX5_9BACL|nr:ABC transporter [Paenibacillus beijingensis]
MKAQRLLTYYLRSKAFYYLFAILLIAAGNVIQAYYPKVLGQFTDRLKSGSITIPDIERYGLILLVIGLLYGSMAGLGQYVIMRLGRGFELLTRGSLFRHFTSLSESYYSKHGVGQMLSYVMNDVTSVRESISVCLNHTTNASILILSAVVMMLTSSIPPFLIVTCVAPLLFIPWLVVRFGPQIRQRSMTVQNSLGAMTEAAEEQFGGIRVTKKFAVERIMITRFGAKVDDIKANQLQLVRISSVFQALLPFLGTLSLIVTIAYGGFLTMRGSISMGSFVSLTLYVRLMINPLQQIGNVINTMQRSRASLERIGKLLATEGDIQEQKEAAPLLQHSADIHIRSLSFRYPGSGRDALLGINLTIPDGKTVGIIGKTGSGKTTLVKLLLRIYDAPAGTIYIGGREIRTVTLESLRGDIAYVPQDGFLFSTTLRDNIAFSQRDASLAAVEAASKEAHIYDSIMGFKEGFGTKLGERGVTLSGGQRQRTSLARGLIKDAPILILDDSVSAVDAVTETAIIGNIRRLRKKKTTLIIAHRISALKHADEIIVLDEGRIAQRGTHSKLLLEEGIYRELYRLQEGGAKNASAT